VISYRLLDEFRGLFEGKKYLHRDSSLGDGVALHLYEDVVALGKSQVLRQRVLSHEHVVNVPKTGFISRPRKSDCTFGDLMPGIVAVVEPGFVVARGPIASVEIGVKVKVLAKAMIKQIGRVKKDLRDQADKFHRGAETPITVGIIGVNYADYAVSYERDRVWRTDGKEYTHPVQEAADAERHLLEDAAPKFDQFVFLRYRATNEQPYPFEWANYIQTVQEYDGALTRISRTYDARFGFSE
jgi:hypothetical protein